MKRRASTLNRWRVSIFKIKFTEFVQLVRFQRNAGKRQKVVPISIPKCRLKAGRRLIQFLELLSVLTVALTLNSSSSWASLLQLLIPISNPAASVLCFPLLFLFAFLSWSSSITPLLHSPALPPLWPGPMFSLLFSLPTLDSSRSLWISPPSLSLQ